MVSACSTQCDELPAHIDDCDDGTADSQTGIALVHSVVKRQVMSCVVTTFSQMFVCLSKR